MPKLSEAYGIDENLAENGREFDLPGGVKVTLRYQNSKKFSAVQRRVFAEMARRSRGGMLDEEGRVEAMRESMAQGAVVAWNLEQDDGRPWPTDRAGVLRAFDASQDLYIDCLNRSGNASFYMTKADAADLEKNSPSGSGTTSSTGEPSSASVRALRQEAG